MHISILENVSPIVKVYMIGILKIIYIAQCEGYTFGIRKL